MGKSVLKKRLPAITLAELIIVLAIGGILIAISSNAILMLFRTQSMAVDEYDLHSASRMASDKVSETIRYSQAVFALPFDYVKNVNAMDPEWDYVAVTSGGKELVEYTYDTTTRKHVPKVLIASQPNVEYEITFDKKSAKTVVKDGKTSILDDNVLHYSVTAYLLSTDAAGNSVRTNKKVVFESEVRALNALQVVDKGTQTAPAVALAYRKDDKTYGEGRSHVVKIGLILDTSGSMAWVPGVDEAYPDPDENEKSRMRLLQEALLGPGLDGNSGILAQFAQHKNFEITLVPFDERAYYIKNSLTQKPFFNSYLHKKQLVTQIKNFYPGGGTNTGDAIRRAYHNMKEFDPSGYNSNLEQHDFTIILVDGDSNMYTRRQRRPLVFHTGNEEGLRVSSGLGLEYVTHLGDVLRNTFSYKGDYYLIGYVSDPESEGVKNIKAALDIPTNQVFMYNASNFNLSEVFSNIATEIMAKTWLVTGPKLME